jgi:hypothetical protein
MKCLLKAAFFVRLGKTRRPSVFSTLVTKPDSITAPCRRPAVLWISSCLREHARLGKKSGDGRWLDVIIGTIVIFGRLFGRPGAASCARPSTTRRASDYPYWTLNIIYSNNIFPHYTSLTGTRNGSRNSWSQRGANYYCT